MTVYIAQLMCPSNHCILAVYGEKESYQQALGLEAIIWSSFENLVATKALNRKCDLCGATTFHVHVAPTMFQSMAEAAEPMREQERLQALTRALFRGMRN